MRPLGFILALSILACDDKKPGPGATEAPSPSASAPVSEPPPAASSSPSPAASASAKPAPPEQIAAQHVLIAWKGATNAPATIKRSKAEAKKRADEVAAKAKEKGADFSALVAEYTDDEGTKGRQGSLGKFAKSKMTPAFADAAFALSVDEVSDPVETPFGYHVIKRNQ